MKAKSLHFSKSGSAQIIASELGRVYQSVCDQVVFVGVEMNGKVPGPVDRFCRDLTPARAKNVAIYVINGSGSTDGVKDLCAAMEQKGVHAVTPLGISVKSSLFKKGMPTDEDVKKTLDWAEKLIANELK
jgi:hypothetical protein